jgi:ABC-type sugar transport system permease subunit
VVITNGGPFFASEVVSGYIARHAFCLGSQTTCTPNPGLASAISILLSLFSLLLAIISVIVFKRFNPHRLQRL